MRVIRQNAADGRWLGQFAAFLTSLSIGVHHDYHPR
jgi:hypothetical protein